MDRARLAYVAALAVGVGSVGFFVWWWKKEKHRPPSIWRKVGELGDLMVFPVKSLGAIHEDSMECTVLGLKSGWLRDRTLVLIDLNSKHVTARKFPAMVQVIPSVAGSALTLQASGMVSITIDLAEIRDKNIRASIQGQAIEVLDCGEEVARWLSRLFLQEEVGLRLVYFPFEKSSRDVRRKYEPFPLVDKVDTGAFPDETSYMMINEASIADLNTRIEDSVTPLHFRPNFVVKGSEPLAEDEWDWVKVGEVIFRNVRPCTRCIFTTIDPGTGKKHPNFEPLKTLRKYRLVKDPKVRAFVGESPAMGIHLALKGPSGVVHLGDPIYVGVPEKDEMFVCRKAYRNDICRKMAEACNRFRYARSVKKVSTLSLKKKVRERLCCDTTDL